MMTLLFILFGTSMWLGWYGKRKPAIFLFLITITLCAFWFKHHASSQLNIDL